MHRRSFVSGCIQAFSAVGLGAFGAHALKERLPADMLDIYQTGIQYHMFHAVALFLVAFAGAHTGERPSIRWAGRLFNIGIVLFSGSLYVLAITEIRALGAITPFGGISFLAGWIMLVQSVRKR